MCQGDAVNSIGVCSPSITIKPYLLSGSSTCLVSAMHDMCSICAVVAAAAAAGHRDDDTAPVVSAEQRWSQPVHPELAPLEALRDTPEESVADDGKKAVGHGESLELLHSLEGGDGIHRNNDLETLSYLRS